MENQKSPTIIEDIYKNYINTIQTKENITNQKELLKGISFLYKKVLVDKQKKIMFDDNVGVAFKTVVLKTNKNEMNQLLLTPNHYDETGLDKNKINKNSVLLLFTYVFKDKEDFDNKKINIINIKTITNIQRKSDRPKSGKTYRYMFDVLKEEEITAEDLETAKKPHLKRVISGKNHEEFVKRILQKDFKYVSKIDEKETINLKKTLDNLLIRVIGTKNIKVTTADFYCYNSKKDLTNLIDDLNNYNRKFQGNNFISNVEKVFEDINNLMNKYNVVLYSAKKLKEKIPKELLEKQKLSISEITEQFNKENLIKVIKKQSEKSKTPSIHLVTKNDKYNFKIRISNFQGDLKNQNKPIYNELQCTNLGITVGKISPKIFSLLGIECVNTYESITNSFEKLTINQLSFVLKVMSGSFLKMKYIH